MHVCLAQEHNTLSDPGQAALKPGPLDSESNALTIFCERQAMSTTKYAMGSLNVINPY